MLERLRMQEVQQIIFSVPDGAVIEGTNLRAGEPVMIIGNPGTSQLFFTSKNKLNEDKGFLSMSSQTRSLDFTINEGSVLYSLWSYLYGTVKTDTTTKMRKVEWIKSIDGKIELSNIPEALNVYVQEEQGLRKLEHDEYDDDKNVITFINMSDQLYFVNYVYNMANVQVTTVKQIQNNIFCAMDIYISAVDMDTDDKYDVCIHCDRVQVFADLVLGVNDSTKASFTPIEIHSIPQLDAGSNNKSVAKIVVNRHGE